MNDCIQPPPLDLLFNASLFLDFDGTLVEIAERPDAVEIDARLGDLLGNLARRLHGRLALISGRPASELRALLGITDITIVGSHGLEFDWAAARTDILPRPPGLGSALIAMQMFAADRPGLIVEDKPLGAALHFRQAPDAASDCLSMAQDLADRHQLHLQHGKMMVEVRATGGDKGSAIRRLMEQPQFQSTAPVFLGDDVTDEAGFAISAQLGGAGVLIGPTRDTAATYRLDGVNDTLGWLHSACEATA
ncbi:trehalose-phosphatase [Altererythrobacter xixiisoli]|uniref:Trehalose 6-phosphate phosphatase n=1 Tax=Croceibacterium xixiisoli TaxID=1476466 RepID=A0A6I4TSV6_9SPHN|nr:trehalose-phosphatase [Croceibacterium xixiisoli]MXO98260.1 trehalose-phosphatase [Croceibacterium xixiisoli]